jgi:hypothetical protein
VFIGNGIPREIWNLMALILNMDVGAHQMKMRFVSGGAVSNSGPRVQNVFEAQFQLRNSRNEMLENDGSYSCLGVIFFSIIVSAPESFWASFCNAWLSTYTVLLYLECVFGKIFMKRIEFLNDIVHNNGDIVADLK